MPSVVSKDADEGSAYIQNGTGTWYKKTNTGDTLDWQLFIFGALGLGGVDNFLPRWDQTGSGVLQDSAIAVLDTGELMIDGFEGALIVSGTDGNDLESWTINGGGASKDALRGAYIKVTGNEFAGAEGSGSISLGLGNELAGTGFRMFDRSGVQAFQMRKEGSLVLGQAGEIVDLTTDTHADSLHVGQAPVSASATSVLEVEDNTNTIVTTVQQDGDILLGKVGSEVTASSLEITDLTDRRLMVPDGALGLVSTEFR